VSYRLGRLAPDYSKPRLWLEDYYVKTSLPVPPQNVDRMSKVSSWPMYLNDRYGDCTIAGAGHFLGAQSAFALGKEVIFSDATITAAYQAVCPGFDPVTDSNDNGATLQNVLAYMSDANAFGTTVLAYAQLKGTDPASLKLALYLFGSVYIGVNLPQSAEQQFSEGKPWIYERGSPIIGGHCVVIQKMTPEYPNESTVVTWGGSVRASDEWLATYMEEAWVAITPDWIQTNQHSVDGLDVAQMTADAAAI
jgi:hypothetical protein